MKKITLEELNDRYDGIADVCEQLQENLVGVDMDEPVVVVPDGFSNMEFHTSLSIEGEIEQLVMRVKHDYEDSFYVEMDVDDIEGTIDSFNLMDDTVLSDIIDTLKNVVDLENEQGLSISIGYNDDEVWLEFTDGDDEYNVSIDNNGVSVEVDGEDEDDDIEDEEQEKRDRLEELRREVAELEEELGE